MRLYRTHDIIYGHLCTGKTTTALAIARELYGPELYKTRTLELNASDERGIKVVREKIKTFAQGSVGQQKKRFFFEYISIHIMLIDLLVDIHVLVSSLSYSMKQIQ